MADLSYLVPKYLVMVKNHPVPVIDATGWMVVFPISYERQTGSLIAHLNGKNSWNTVRGRDLTELMYRVKLAVEMTSLNPFGEER